jgi:hypothetical protein
LEVLEIVEVGRSMGQHSWISPQKSTHPLKFNSHSASNFSNDEILASEMNSSTLSTTPPRRSRKSTASPKSKQQTATCIDAFSKHSISCFPLYHQLSEDSNSIFQSTLGPSVRIRSNNFSSQSLRALLERCQNLNSLTIIGTSLTDEMIDCFGHLSEMQTLSLWTIRHTLRLHAIQRFCGQFSSLRHLLLNAPVTTSFLENCCNSCAPLKCLNLKSLQQICVEDVSSLIASSNHWKSVEIVQPGSITREGLIHLSDRSYDCAGMENLSLCNIGDSITNDDLKTLSGLGKLKNLRLIKYL